MDPSAGSSDFHASFSSLRRELETTLLAISPSQPPSPSSRSASGASTPSGSSTFTSKPKPDLSLASTQLADLKAALSANIAFLPAYDQRSYTAQVDDVEKRLSALRSKVKPKSRFAFSRAGGVPSGTLPVPAPAPASSAGVHAEAERLTDPSRPGASGGTSALAGASSAKSTRLISDRSSSVIRLPEPESESESTPDPASRQDGQTISLARLSGCIVDFGSFSSSNSRAASAPSTPTLGVPPFAMTPASNIPGATSTPAGPADTQETGAARVTSLHAKILRRCVVIAAVEGSAILEDLEDCVVLLSARQFRIHSSRRTAILLHVPSTPIIEHSTALYIGALPSFLLPAWRLPRANPLGGGGGNDSEDVHSRHEQVQDFDWVKSGKSPNWTPLGATASELVLTPEDADAIARLREGMDGEGEAGEVEEMVRRLTASIGSLASLGGGDGAAVDEGVL